ncbi:hypothetical protein GCM10011357_34890 [Lacimicrobium alkaliphilum]|uniref:Ankyrin n=2 Tax=Lacimicrobium alkaliphilum TaxID=1526571 RepID=A0ABQ1RPB8_9ALTE|nr:hypothetical protein GCM10011357_34890 [Lacimicrobium alkaliphilum]
MSLKLQAKFLAPDEVNLIDPPLDSVQRTLWNDFPVIIHRRTQEQLKFIERSFEATPSEAQRFLSYQSIARTHGHEFASAIMEFTENYIAAQNVYMSELPEFGIYSQVSPILGCAVFKADRGFIDPCNNVEFDFTGKVKNHSGYEHLRLTVPPHRVVDNKLEFIKDYKPKEVIDFTPNILEMNVSDIEKALFAIDFERLDILKKICGQNPEVLTQKNSAGTNLIQMAAYHDSTLDYLLGFENIQLEHVNKAGYTALMFAVWNEKFKNAEKLIKRGATPQSYFYQDSYVPSIYEFMVNEYLFTEDVAREIHEKLLEIGKTARDG